MKPNTTTCDLSQKKKIKNLEAERNGKLDKLEKKIENLKVEFKKSSADCSIIVSVAAALQKYRLVVR
jgi:hypothetical protein